MKPLNYYLSTFNKTYIGLFVLFLILSCGDQKNSSLEIEKSNSDIEAEVKKEIEALYDVFTKSDLKWVDYYKKEYTVAARDGSFQTKHSDSLRIEWEDIYNRYDVILQDHGKPTVFADGNQALHFNTYDEIYINKATNDTTRSIGSWIVLWEKQIDNSWKIEFETITKK